MSRRLLALALSLTVATSACVPLAASTVAVGAGTVAASLYVVPKTNEPCAGSMSCVANVLLGASLFLVGLGLVAGGGIALGADALK